MTRFRIEQRIVQLSLALLFLAGAVWAEVSVVMTYDTRVVGEIEPCG